MPIFKQFARFAVSGFIATGVHLGVVYYLVWQGVSSATLANGTAYVAANLTSYFLNARWSFSSNTDWKTLRRHLVASTFLFTVTLMLARLGELLTRDIWVTTLLVVLTMPFTSFAVHRGYVYRK